MRYETPHYKMKNLINNINCWRLNRLMIKASTLDAKIERLGIKIERLGIKIERWENLNTKEL